MINLGKKLLLAGITILVSASNVSASDSLSYSGRLVNANGSPVTGTANLTFDLAYSGSPGIILCSQSLNGVDLSNGVFHVKLAFPDCTPEINTLLANTPANETVVIRVTDRTPDPDKAYSFQAIHSVPYSFISQMTKQLEQMSAVDGQVLAWDNTAKKWLPKTPAASSGGTLTSITAGDGLSGGTITGSGTIAIATDGVTTTHIDDETITNSDISLTAEIAQSKIANLTTDLNNKEEKLPAGGVNTDYLDGTKTWKNFDESVRGSLLLNLGTGTAAPITDTNTVLEALENLQAQILSNDTAFDGAGQWSKTGDKIFYNTDHVGIGTANPNEKLEVVGNIALSGKVRFKDSGSNYVELKAPVTIGSNVTFTLPGTQGTNGQVLRTDASGNLSWVTLSTDSSGIIDGSIVDADISAGANIAQSKIAGLDTSLTSIQNSITNLNTGAVAESSNLYFTEARVLATDLAGLNTTGGSITSADTVLSSIGKLIGNHGALSSAQNNYVLKSGDTMSGNLQMGGNSISGLTAPIDDSDAATKLYVDTKTADVASQWMETGSDIYYDTGKVGIGTSTPTRALDIIQNTSDTATATEDILVLNRRLTGSPISAGWGAGLLFRQSNQVDQDDYDAARVRSYWEASDNRFGMAFDTRSSSLGGLQTKMVITASGNVGIGTTSPLNKLDVSGNIAATGKLRLKSDTVNYVELIAPAGLGATTSYTFPTTSGTNGYALTTNGAGGLSWSAVATTATTVGGDLSGSIANAQLVANSVGSAELANASVTYAKLSLADGEVPVAKVNGLQTALDGKEPAITNPNDTLKYWRGDKTWAALNTAVVPESTNQYFTQQRVLDSLLTGYGAVAASALPIGDGESVLTSLKKLQLQITANDAAFDSTGQWSKNGSIIYYNGGNVGIGTSNPLSNLEVFSGVNASVDDDDDGIVISNFQPSLYFKDRTTGDPDDVRIRMQQSDLLFERSADFFIPAPTFQTNMVIKASGNVGIGTELPSKKFHVEVAGHGDGVQLKQTADNAGGYLTFEDHDGKRSDIMTFDDNYSTAALANSLTMVARDGKHLNFYTSADSNVGTASMVIKNNGKVAIGNSSPMSKFEITAPPVVTSPATPNEYALRIVRENDYGGMALLDRDGNAATTNDSSTVVLYGDDFDDNMHFSHHRSGALALRHDVTILGNNGNVGVGTTTPSYRLESSGPAQTSDFVALALAGKRTYVPGEFGTVSMNFTLPEGPLSSDRVQGIIRVGHEADHTSAEGFMSFFTRISGVPTEKMRLSSDGKLGVGTTTPAEKLHVMGYARLTGPSAVLQLNETDGLMNTWWLTADGNYFSIRKNNAGTYPFVISDAGNIGISNSAPTYKLDVSGDLRITGTPYRNGGDIAWTVPSDKRLKDITGSHDYGLEEIAKLKTLKYKYKENNPAGATTDQEYIGVLAQDVQKVIPEAVSVNPENGFLNLNSGPIFWTMVKATKELKEKADASQQKVEELKRGLASLKEENEKLKKQNESFEKRLEALEKKSNQRPSIKE